MGSAAPKRARALVGQPTRAQEDASHSCPRGIACRCGSSWWYGGLRHRVLLWDSAPQRLPPERTEKHPLSPTSLGIKRFGDLGIFLNTIFQTYRKMDPIQWTLIIPFNYIHQSVTFVITCFLIYRGM